MTKAELLKAAGIDATKLSCLPPTFIAKCHDIGVDPFVIFAGWFYDDIAPMGRPLPMSELWEIVYTKKLGAKNIALIGAIKALKWGVKGCKTCGGIGEVTPSAFDEPPESCPKCGDVHAVITQCEEALPYEA